MYSVHITDTVCSVLCTEQCKDNGGNAVIVVHKIHLENRQGSPTGMLPTLTRPPIKYTNLPTPYSISLGMESYQRFYRSIINQLKQSQS